MSYFKYIIISTICLSLFYLVYQLMYKNDRRFKHLRFFLLASVILSITLPMSTFRLKLDSSLIKHDTQTYLPVVSKIPSLKMNRVDLPVLSVNPPLNQRETDYSHLFIKIYFIISIALIARIIIQLTTILFRYFGSNRQKQGRYFLIFNEHVRNASSFFNLIFINSELKDKDEADQMILHEKIHASQYHSVDIILIELLAAIMWFNPAVWLVKKSMLQVHEYLADEGVLSAGFDRLNYQTLLVNQLIEEKHISLSSNFNSLIKKRMIMLKQDETTQKSKFKLLFLMPISLALFIAISVLNGLMPNPVKAEASSLKNISMIKNYHLNQAQNVATPEDTSKRTKKQGQKKSSKEIVAENNIKDTLKDIKVVSIPVDSTNAPGNMVYIVDGVYVFHIYNIPVETIESVNILKEDNLMVIRTKNFAKKKPSFKVKSEMNDLSNTQIFIDGVEQPFGFNVENLRNEDIESINVVKDLSLSKSILYITTKHVLNFQH